jgi:hypothetical protein
MLIVTITKGESGQPSGQPRGGTYRRCKEVCRSWFVRNRRGYMKRVARLQVTPIEAVRLRSSGGIRARRRYVRLGAVGASGGTKGGAGGPSRAATGTARTRQGIDALAVDVLIALGECDAAERRAGQLLQTMIEREQLSLRQRSPARRHHPVRSDPARSTSAARRDSESLPCANHSHCRRTALLRLCRAN